LVLSGVKCVGDGELGNLSFVHLINFAEHLTFISEISIARIAEVLDPKELREGMNRQDTYQEGQQADDQTGKFFIFASGL
jgi:hypothetical protein